MSQKPQPIEYHLDSYSLNVYKKGGGRDEDSAIAAITWKADLPAPKGASIIERSDTKSISQSFTGADCADQAWQWILDEIESEG